MPKNKKVKNEEQSVEDVNSQNESLKSNPKKKWIIIGVIILTVAFAQAALMVLLYGGVAREVLMSADVEEVETEVEEEIITYRFPLEQMSINLKSSTNNHYLKTTIQLVYKDEETAAILTERVGEIQEVIINHLREKTVDEINTVEKSESLKPGIVNDINELLESDNILDLHYSQYLYN